MKHPTTDAVFARLLAVRAKIAESIVGDPFVPYVGAQYAAQSDRILFIGKATADWLPAQSADEAKRNSERFVQTEVIGGGYRKGQFWHFLHAVTQAVHNSPDADRASTMPRIAWSNLMKLDIDGYNPHGTAADVQRDLCTEMLVAEVEELKPTLIWLVTGDYEADMVRTVFGSDAWNAAHPDAHVKIDRDNARVIVWSRHPQGWGAAAKEEATRLAVATYRQTSSLA